MFSVARKSVLHAARAPLRATAFAHPSPLTRLLSTLALLEQKDGKLQPSSLCAISAGATLGGPVTAFVAGSGVKAVADGVARIKGVDKIVYVDSAAYDKVSTPHTPAMAGH